MTSNAILNAREAIKKDFQSYDNSFRVKKSSLKSILQDIDNNTSISDSEIKRKFGIWFNLAMLQSRRKSTSLAEYLESMKNSLAIELDMYKSTYSTVYKVDDKFLDWWTLQPHEDDTDKELSWFSKDSDMQLLEYNGVVYSLQMSSDSCVIRVLSEYNVSAKLNYEYSCSLDDTWDRCNLMCGNQSCPHYKASTGKAYNDGAKEVFCSLGDLQKCHYCDEIGIAEPMIVKMLFEGIAYTMRHREVSTSSSSNRDDYEHLPKLEREDDVIVYFGVVSPKKPLPFKKVEPSVFPESHASPREHYRRGGERRAYTRKDGTKVRATTVKGTVVNKGHNKTTYTFKERRSEK